MGRDRGTIAPTSRGPGALEAKRGVGSLREVESLAAERFRRWLRGALEGDPALIDDLTARAHRPVSGGGYAGPRWPPRRTGSTGRGPPAAGGGHGRRAARRQRSPRESDRTRRAPASRRGRLRAGGSRRLGPRGRPRGAGRLPVHARRLPHDVPRAALDDAAVRRVRHRRRDERTLPVPAGAGPGRALGGLRHAHADGPGLRRPAERGRGRALRRGHGFAPGLRRALRRHPAREHHDLDDDQRPGHRGVRVLPGGRGAPGCRLGAPRRHPADGHPEGVHRAEGVDLPAAPAPAPDRRPDGVLRRTLPAVPSAERLRLPHPRGRSDRGAGAGVHARGRLRLRGARPAARPRRERLRAGPVVLLQRAHRLLRGDREAAGRPADLGALAAGALRRHGSRCDAAALPHADGGGLAHGAAADEQRGAHGGGGAGGGARRHPVAAHQRAGRGPGAPHRGRGEARVADAAGHRGGDGGRRRRPIRWAAPTSWSP